MIDARHKRTDGIPDESITYSSQEQKEAQVPSKPRIRRLSSDLKKEGLEQIVLLTGDSEVVAQQIGKLARVDRVVARCLPEEKVRIVQELASQKHRVLMVGDGVNDAPALATATVGIALGAQGLTAAASAADAVLLSTDILRVATAVRLAWGGRSCEWPCKVSG